MLPRQALALYEASEVEIQAYVTRLLCRRDSVLDAALNEVEGVSKDRAYLLLALVCLALSGESHVSQNDLSDLYHEWVEMNPDSDPEGDRVAELVWELEGAGLSTSEGNDGFAIDLAQLPTPLCAMYYDQKQRRGGDMLLSLMTLLGVKATQSASRRRAARERLRSCE